MLFFLQRLINAKFLSRYTKLIKDPSFSFDKTKLYNFINFKTYYWNDVLRIHHVTSDMMKSIIYLGEINITVIDLFFFGAQL